ncbi:hypothetical protein N2152v2_008690 [Parachlorella kessleri]
MSDTSFFANLDDPTATPLHWAAQQGNLDEVQALLAAEPGTCKAVDSHGWTALHWAAGAGQAQCVALLRRAGASLEARGSESHTPWVSKLRPPAAGRAADLPLLGQMFSRDSKATEGATPLHIAAALGHVECVRQLLQLQACREAANSLGFTGLHLAAACNQLETVRELVRSGADAAAKSAADSVQELLAAGADVEAGSLKGIRPLHTAAMFGHTEAAACGNVDFVTALPAAGADINATNTDGAHCLHHFLDWVAHTKAEDTVQRLQQLLDAGASVPLACRQRPTPVDLLLLQEDNPSSCNLPAWAPELIRMMAAAGCPVRAPLTMRDRTPGIPTMKWWFRSLIVNDWAAQWPAALSGSAVDIGVALLQSAATEPRTESISEAVGLVKLAMAAGSIQLVVAALGLLPKDSLDVKLMMLACVVFMTALKALPSPDKGSWGERHHQVVHHYCSMAQALLAAGCAPVMTLSGQDLLDYVKVPGWAAQHLRELLQVVASGQSWSPDEAHLAFPPAFRAATRALLLANHRGLEILTPGSEYTAEPGQKIGARPPGDSRARVRLPTGVVLLILEKAAHPPAAWVPQLQPGGLAPPSNAVLAAWKLAVAAAAAVVGLAVALVRRRWLR